MNRFPRYGRSYPYYNPYYRYNFPPQPYQSPIVENNKSTGSNDEHTTKQSKENRSVSGSNDIVWFDLFGIKLYFDDVLILSLLFFLYKEEVKDEGLFLALVLLLIS